MKNVQIPSPFPFAEAAPAPPYRITGGTCEGGRHPDALHPPRRDGAVPLQRAVVDPERTVLAPCPFVLPLIVFILFGRHIVGGLMEGAVKA